MSTDAIIEHLEKALAAAKADREMRQRPEPEIGAIEYRYVCLRSVEIGPHEVSRYRAAGWSVSRMHLGEGISLNPANWFRHLAQEYGMWPYRYEGNNTWRWVETPNMDDISLPLDRDIWVTPPT